MALSIEEQVAVLRNDIKWIKWTLGVGLAALAALHFVDPGMSWWIFRYP